MFRIKIALAVFLSFAVLSAAAFGSINVNIDADEPPRLRMPDSPDSVIQHPGYRTADYVFDSDGTQLGGTLVLPETEGPHPAALLLHGAGGESRESFWRVGEVQMLVERGIAVFVYDKRGTGVSGGSWQEATLDDLANDAAAAIRVARSHPAVDPERVGVIGFSQGGRVAMRLAAESEDLAYIVNVSGSAVPFAMQEAWGIGNELAGRGYSERAVATAIKATQMLYSARGFLSSGTIPLNEMYFWFIHLDPYADPADDLRRIDEPVLLVLGGADGTTPSAETFKVTRDIIGAGGHPDSQVVVFPGAGHVTQTETGELSPGLADTLVTWVNSPSIRVGDPITSERVDGFSDELVWHGTGEQVRPWHVSAGLHLPILALLVVASVAGLVIGVMLAFNRRTPAFAHLVLTGASVVNLLSLMGLIVTLGYLLVADADGLGPEIPFAAPVSVLAITSALLSVGMVFSWARLIQSGNQRRGVLVFYGVVAAAAIAQIGMNAYWNILGPAL